MLESAQVSATASPMMVSFLELEFNIHVNDEEIVPKNVEALETLAAFVNQERSSYGGRPATARRAPPDVWPIARAYGLLKTHGLRAGSREILKRFSKRINEYNGRRAYVVVGKTLGGDLIGAGRSLPDSVLDVREAEPEEILALRPAEEPRMRSYLSKKYRCALLVIDGETAGWCWWIDSRVSERGAIDHQLKFFNVLLSEGDAWFFDYYVMPQYRGGGRATSALAKLEHMLAAKGYETMMGYVERTNIAALSLYKRREFETIRTVKATYLFSLVGISRGRLVVRVDERRGPATFPFRPMLVVGAKDPSLKSVQRPRPKFQL